MDIGHDQFGRPFPHPDAAHGVARADDQRNDLQAGGPPPEERQGQRPDRQPEPPRESQQDPLHEPWGFEPPPSASGPTPVRAAAAPLAEGDGPGSVDKIRDILFGVQMRDYDARFAQLEARLLKESSALRDDANRRFDALEALLTQQMAALGDRLSGESGSRGHAVQELSQRITDLVQHVEQRTRQIDDQAGQNLRDLQQQLQDQTRALTTEMGSGFDGLSATLDRQTSALRDEKADRASIAALLTDVARRLHPESGSNEPSGSGGTR